MTRREKRCILPVISCGKKGEYEKDGKNHPSDRHCRRIYGHEYRPQLLRNPGARRASVSLLKSRPKLASGVAVSVGVVILVVGYTLGRAYVYSTPEYALIKLPFEFLQGIVGAVVGMILCWRCGIRKLYLKMVGE